MKKIANKVKDLKVTDAETFLTWDFNTLKDPKRDVSKLKKAIITSGWSFPVIVWKKFVIDGAGRKKAVEELVADGYSLPEIPYVEIEAKNLEDAKQKALEVSSQFGDITKESFMAFTEGMELDFGTFELKGIKEDMFITAEDKDEAVPETPKTPKSKLGDVYLLGKHKVICGDSTDLDVTLSLSVERQK